MDESRKRRGIKSTAQQQRNERERLTLNALYTLCAINISIVECKILKERRKDGERARNQVRAGATRFSERCGIKR